MSKKSRFSNITSVRIYRWTRYFQDGFSYLSYPITLINFLTIIFYLLLDKVPWMKILFPHFIIFALVSITILLPLSAFIGFLHIKHSRMYEAENVLMTENNPISVHTSRVYLDNQVLFMSAVGVEPTKEFMEIHAYWKRLDEKIRWRP